MGSRLPPARGPDQTGEALPFFLQYSTSFVPKSAQIFHFESIRILFFFRPGPFSPGRKLVFFLESQRAIMFFHMGVFFLFWACLSGGISLRRVGLAPTSTSSICENHFHSPCVLELALGSRVAVGGLLMNEPKVSVPPEWASLDPVAAHCCHCCFRANCTDR